MLGLVTTLVLLQIHESGGEGRPRENMVFLDISLVLKPGRGAGVWEAPALVIQNMRDHLM